MTNLVTGRPNSQYMVITQLIVDESDRKKLIQSSLAEGMTCGIHMKKKKTINSRKVFPAELESGSPPPSPASLRIARLRLCV